VSRIGPNSSGFTLIELVVALAVLALASLLVVEALRFGLRTWDSVSDRLARAGAVSIAQEVLRDRMTQMYPGAPGPSGPVQGQAGEVSFTAPGPHALAGRYLRFRIYLDRMAGGGALTLAWQPTDPRSSSDGLPAAGEEVLLQGVDQVAFDYFARAGSDHGSWTSSWTNPAKLPLLVRLRLHFSKGGEADWPDLVVRPRIDMTAACEFDLVSRRCR
jgi:general secretion pathway protein J